MFPSIKYFSWQCFFTWMIIFLVFHKMNIQCTCMKRAKIICCASLILFCIGPRTKATATAAKKISNSFLCSFFVFFFQMGKSKVIIQNVRQHHSIDTACWNETDIVAYTTNVMLSSFTIFIQYWTTRKKASELSSLWDLEELVCAFNLHDGDNDGSWNSFRYDKKKVYLKEKDWKFIAASY